MNELYAIGWFIALIISVIVVFDLIGMRLMVQFFPEGRRWWQFPAQLASLTVFALVVLCHPF